MEMEFGRPAEGLEFVAAPWRPTGSGKAPVSRTERTRRRPVAVAHGGQQMASRKAGHSDAG